MNESEINGALLRLKRESLGLTLADMASRACLSPKQIKQLEEGGDSAFYSLAIKLVVAKKVAYILDVSEDDLFSRAKSANRFSSDESLEQIEAEQLALLASFESDAPSIEATQPDASAKEVLKKADKKSESDATTVPASKDEAVVAEAAPIPNLKIKESVVVAEAAPLESHALKVASVEHVSHEANVNQFLLGEEPQITSEDASTEQHPLQKLIVLVVLVFLLVLVFSSEARRSVMDWTNELGLTSFASSEPSESPDASAVAPLEGAASETNANTASVAPTAAVPVGAASSAATAAPSSTTNVNASSAPKDKPAAVSAPTVNAAEAPNKSISANVSPAPNVAVQNPQ